MALKPICVVAGGSSGLGKEIAKCVLRRGLPVCKVSRSQKRLADAVLDKKTLQTAELVINRL